MFWLFHFIQLTLANKHIKFFVKIKNDFLLNLIIKNSKHFILIIVTILYHRF